MDTNKTIDWESELLAAFEESWLHINLRFGPGWAVGEIWSQRWLRDIVSMEFFWFRRHLLEKSKSLDEPANLNEIINSEHSLANFIRRMA